MVFTALGRLACPASAVSPSSVDPFFAAPSVAPSVAPSAAPSVAPPAGGRRTSQYPLELEILEIIRAPRHVQGQGTRDRALPLHKPRAHDDNDDIDDDDDDDDDDDGDADNDDVDDYDKMLCVSIL